MGVTYRHLLYVLADFVKRGLLIRKKQEYYIADLEGLTALGEIQDGKR